MDTVFEHEITKVLVGLDEVVQHLQILEISAFVVIEDIEIVVVNNSKKSENLRYENFKKEGRKIIVVGGFSLSRGLTLEGLITSYYLRYSKMYDSMLQMGRWFGYRMGYEDLCKLYLSKESHDDFVIISQAVDELSIKFEEMQAINATQQKWESILNEC